MTQFCSSVAHVLHLFVTATCSWLTASFTGINTPPSGKCPNPYSFPLKKWWLLLEKTLRLKIRWANVLFSLRWGSSEGRWFANSVRDVSAFWLVVTKSQEKKSRVTWMRLICHGNSIYFTDLNLGSPTSSLHSCGSLLINLYSFITFQSKIALMLSIFGTECVWDAVPLAEHSLVFCTTHTNLGSTKSLTAAPAHWVQGAADLNLMQGVIIIWSQVCSSAPISGCLHCGCWPHPALRVSQRLTEGCVKVAGKYTLFL